MQRVSPELNSAIISATAPWRLIWLTEMTIWRSAEPLFSLFSMITLVSLVNSTLLSLSFTLVLGVLTRVDSWDFHRSWSFVRKKQRESLVCSPWDFCLFSCWCWRASCSCMLNFSQFWLQRPTQLNACWRWFLSRNSRFFLGTPRRVRFARTSSGSVIVSSVPSVISLSEPVSSLSLPRFEVHTS